MIYGQRAATEKAQKDLWQAQEMKFKASQVVSEVKKKKEWKKEKT